MNVILKGEKNPTTCVITPPVVIDDPMFIHDLSSYADVDYELAEFTVTGDCAIKEYQVTIASSTGNSFSWFNARTRGVNVYDDGHTSSSVSGVYEITVTALGWCSISAAQTFKLHVAECSISMP